MPGLMDGPVPGRLSPYLNRTLATSDVTFHSAIVFTACIRLEMVLALPDTKAAKRSMCTHLQPRTELWLARVLQVPDAELPLASSRGQQVGAQVAELQAIHLQQGSMLMR